MAMLQFPLCAFYFLEATRCLIRPNCELGTAAHHHDLSIYQRRTSLACMRIRSSNQSTRTKSNHWKKEKNLAWNFNFSLNPIFLRRCCFTESGKILWGFEVKPFYCFHGLAHDPDCWPACLSQTFAASCLLHIIQPSIQQAIWLASRVTSYFVRKRTQPRLDATGISEPQISQTNDHVTWLPVADLASQHSRSCIMAFGSQWPTSLFSTMYTLSENFQKEKFIKICATWLKKTEGERRSHIYVSLNLTAGACRNAQIIARNAVNILWRQLCSSAQRF